MFPRQGLVLLIAPVQTQNCEMLCQNLLQERKALAAVNQFAAVLERGLASFKNKNLESLFRFIEIFIRFILWTIKESGQTNKFSPVQTIIKNVNFRARNGKYCLLTVMFFFLNLLLSPVLVNILNIVPPTYFDLT